MTTPHMRWLFRHFVFGIALCAIALIVNATPLRAQPYAAVVMDARTGEILHSRNSNARLHPASLTKMMTLYIAFEAVENGEIDLDTRVRISATAARQPPSRLGLRAGQRISFRHLIRAAALRSANDAATAIAEALEGSVDAFAARMNRTAAAIGMSRTRFRNPHGLTQEGHLSTARDMSTLGRQLFFDFPEYYNLFSRLTEDAGIAQVRNTNRRLLQGYEGADGIKTGFTNAAGYNLTAMAARGSRRVLVTVFGARSTADRHRRVTELLDRGFRESPRRAAIRRPARPNYVRGADDSGSGVPAGRTIRLQRAPTTSLIPPRRPDPNAPPPPEIIAAIAETVGDVLEDIQETEDPDLPNAGADDPPRQIAALERSLIPRGRPARARTEQDNAEQDNLVTAEAAPGTAEPVDTPTGTVALGETMVAGVTDESAPADGVGAALLETLAAALDDGASAHSADVSAQLADPQASGQTSGPLGGAAQASMPLQFGHDPVRITDVTVRDGVVMIPGLPAIVPPEALAAMAPVQNGAQNGVQTGAQNGAQSGATALADATIETPATAALAPPAPLVQAASIEPAQTGLVVDESGRILWQDEELLSALEDDTTAETIVPPVIVLTSSMDDTARPDPEPQTQIVAMVATSGGRLFGVELGRHSSAFDAERMLLRLALSEGSALGTGVRRVQSVQGRYAAQVHGLTEDEANNACLRLQARSQPCEVLPPAS